MTTGTFLLPPCQPGHFVYRAYAADGCLLYVGVTSNLLGRLGDHARKRLGGSAWVWEAERIEWDMYEQRYEAERAETRLIQEFHPQYNVAANAAAPAVTCPHPTQERARQILTGMYEAMPLDKRLAKARQQVAALDAQIPEGQRRRMAESARKADEIRMRMRQAQ